MRIRFTEEFDKINKQYNIVFKELFGGGEVYLSLLRMKTFWMREFV